MREWDGIWERFDLLTRAYEVKFGITSGSGRWWVSVRRHAQTLPLFQCTGATLRETILAALDHPRLSVAELN